MMRVVVRSIIAGFILLFLGLLLLLFFGGASNPLRLSSSTVERCFNAIKATAFFPSSVSISAFTTQKFIDDAGREHVISDFTAKNHLGIKIPLTANCIVDYGKLTLTTRPR